MLWLKMLQTKLGTASSRIRAFEQLAASNDPRAFEMLAREILEDSESSNLEVKRAAVEMLGKVEDPQAVRILVQVLEKNKSDLMAAAANALLEQKQIATIPYLVGALRELDPDILFAVQRAICAFEEAAVPDLIKGLTDINHGVQRNSADTLFKIGGPAVPALLEKLTDADKETRPKLEGVLLKIGTSTKEPLILALKDENPDVRRSVARVLRELKAPVAVSFLAEQLRDPAANVREEVAAALKALDWKPPRQEDAAWLAVGLRDWKQSATLGILAAEPLAASLEHLEDPAWETPGEQLIDIGSAAVPFLLPALKAPRARLRARSLRILAEIGDPSSIPAVNQALTDPDQEVRQAAVLVLWKLKSPEGLLRALTDEDMLIRARAAKALGSMRAAAARAPLLELLNNCPPIRPDVALALGRIAPVEVFPVLLELSLEVATADEAIAALVEILESAPADIESSLLDKVVRSHNNLSRHEAPDELIKKSDGSFLRGLALAELERRRGI